MRKVFTSYRDTAEKSLLFSFSQVHEGTCNRVCTPGWWSDVWCRTHWWVSVAHIWADIGSPLPVCQYQRQWRRSLSIVIKSVKVGSADAHFNAHKAQVPAAAAQQHPLCLRLERCTVPTTASQPVSRNSPRPPRVPWLVPVCWLMLGIITLRPSPLSSVCPVAQERSVYWSQ